MRNTKTSIAIAIAALCVFAVFAGCKDNPVQDYGQGLIDSHKTSEAAGGAASLEAIKKTVSVYYATNEKYPASLDEIARIMGQPLDPAKFDYSPATGAVTRKK